MFVHGCTRYEIEDDRTPEGRYGRLRARKEGESFTGLIDRILDESQPDWRDAHGSLNGREEDAQELINYAVESREGFATGASERQDEATDALTEATDEAPWYYGSTPHVGGNG